MQHADSAWQSTEVPKILASQAYATGALFILWDESNSWSAPIGMIVLSPNAKGGGYQNTIHYDHSSTLRTVEEIFALTPMLGGAANATTWATCSSASRRTLTVADRLVLVLDDYAVEKRASMTTGADTSEPGPLHSTPRRPPRSHARLLAVVKQ